VITGTLQQTVLNTEEVNKMDNKIIIVRRPEDHHKGPKTVATWNYGEPVPPGVIIGKGSIITVETKTN